jgi:hypothetical protein
VRNDAPDLTLLVATRDALDKRLKNFIFMRDSIIRKLIAGSAAVTTDDLARSHSDLALVRAQLDAHCYDHCPNWTKDKHCCNRGCS